jgi:hypothetical protein
MPSMRALILGPLLALGLGFAGLTASAAAQSAPTCVPTSIDNSALQAGGITLSPLPGSRDASAQTQISFLGVPAHDVSVQSVSGSRTGPHPGRLAAYSQGNGASFLPAKPFDEGERVTVRARARVGGAWRPVSDVFAIARSDAISSTPETIHPGTAAQEQRFRSRPDLRPPVVTVTANSPAVAPGDIFLAPYVGPGQAGPMILDADGGLLWFKSLPHYTSATNLRVQEYEGQRVLTWWQGDISIHGFGTGEDVIYSDAYTDVANVRGGNGHRPDLHDFVLTPQGTALVTSYFPVLCDLSSSGGASYAGLTDGVMQEIDVRTGLVMYEWTSLDHVGVGESYESIGHSSTRYPYDFFHINSINVDRDRTLLISARNTWTIYDLNAATGQIVWRLGGKHSSFNGAASTRTAWQHDPRELPDGSISVFDNGSTPTVHPQSRAIVLSLNPQAGTATLVTQLTHSPALVAESQGNAQALPNGDWFVGWGQEPFFSELSPSGQPLFDAHLPPHTQSYRSLREPWAGTPAHRPALAFVPGGAGAAATAYASWNGATGVASWRLLAGGSSSPGALRAILTVPRSGFETALGVPPGTIGPWIAVQALDGGGRVLAASAAIEEAALR